MRSSIRISSMAVALILTTSFVVACGSSQVRLPGRVPSFISPPYRNAAAFKVLHDFTGRNGGTDGASPDALIDVDGTLYGTTSKGGGKPSSGTVFQISTLGTERVLHHFRPAPDGKWPSGLTQVSGLLYGVTLRAGGSEAGTIFRIQTSGGYHTLYSFRGGEDGAAPSAGPTEMGGMLYGITLAGGSGYGSGCDRGGCGTIYRVSASGNEQVLYSFKNTPDGAEPDGHMIAVNGTLYGTTYIGGANGRGTVFSFSIHDGEHTLYSFKGAPTDGAYPESSLLYVKGTFYGTTTGGGTFCGLGCGTVFSVSTSGAERIVYKFRRSSDGHSPYAGLTRVGSVLYGTTWSGGDHGSGTIFEVTTSGVEHVLHSFTGSQGSSPNTHLVALNGALYGTTLAGGSAGGGTVFKFTP